jgi:hypothetical protein
MSAADAFTAQDPAGELWPVLTRLTPQAVERAYEAQFRGMEGTARRPKFWSLAREAGWRVVPVAVTRRRAAP